MQVLHVCSEMFPLLKTIEAACILFRVLTNHHTFRDDAGAVNHAATQAA
jgi:hypothetical protein